MKKNKIVIVIASVLFVASMLVSCHRSTCPTFGKADVRMEVRS